MQGSSPRVQTGGTRRGGAGDDGERRRTALRTGPRRGGASPGAWTPRVGSWGTCEVGRWVRAGQDPTAASNFGSGGVHLRQRLGEIPALAWLNSWDRKLGEILGAEA
jgi:hypothetical protein